MISDKGKEVTAETRCFLAELLKYFVATPETERDRDKGKEVTASL